MRKTGKSLASSIGRTTASTREAKKHIIKTQLAMLSALLIVTALLAYKLAGDWFPLAGERQNYARPQFETLAFVIRNANIDKANAIVSARSALPHFHQEEKFTDASQRIVDNQVKELNAFIELNSFSGRVEGYLQTVVQDLIDQKTIGVISESEFSDINKRFKTIEAEIDQQKHCVEQAQNRVAILAAGSIDRSKQGAAMAESALDLVSRVKGTDIVGRCFTHADQVMNETAAIVYVRDDHVMPFNKKAAANTRWREIANLPLTLAMFFLGGSVKELVPQLLMKLITPIRKRYGRRLYRFGQKEVVTWPKKSPRRDFWK